MGAISTGTALALMAAGTAVSAFGSIQAGQAAKNQANVQAAIYGQQAERERQVAAANEVDFRRQQAKQMASRRAIMGASGVDPSSGSPLLVSEDFAGEVELQALRIRNGGEVSATRLEQQGTLTRMAGNQAQTSSYFRAGSSLLQGFGQVGYYASDAKGIT
jgi:hypothetical protein